MNREYHIWYSSRVDRAMELLVFGHAGAKVLAFPTRDGRFFEYENLGVIDALAEKIQAGQLQLFCVDNIYHENIYCSSLHPAERIQRHIQFEEYILNEVIPFMESKNSHECTIAYGCSLGAFQAANIAFRHPHLFKKLCAFSGRYDLTWAVEFFNNLFDDYYDENIYFNTPTHFLPQLQSQGQLEHLQHMDIVFAIGKQDPFLNNNHCLSEILSSKGIPHTMHEWEERAHSGRYWRQMAVLYL